MKNKTKIALLGTVSVALTVLSCTITMLLGTLGIESPSVIAMALLAAGAGAGALYFMSSSNMLRPVPATIAAVIAMIMLTSQRIGLIYVMLVLGTICASILVAHNAKLRKKRISTVLGCDFIIGGATVIGMAMTVLMMTGSFSFNFAVHVFNSYFNGLETKFAEAMQSLNMYELMSSTDIYDLSGYTAETFYPAYAASLVLTIKVISPAIAVTALNIYSYLITAFFCACCKICKWQAAIPGQRWITVPNIVSAHIFRISTAVYWIMNIISLWAESSVFVLTVELVAENLMIILIPVFCLRGLDYINIVYHAPLGRRQAVMNIVLILITFILSPLFAFVFLGLIGATNQIAAVKIRKFRGQNGDQNPENQ